MSGRPHACSLGDLFIKCDSDIFHSTILVFHEDSVNAVSAAANFPALYGSERSLDGAKRNPGIIVFGG